MPDPLTEWSGTALEGVERAMRRALSPPEPAVAELYGWLSYHIGYSDLEGRPELGRRGKGVRPTLCLLACAAAGGTSERAERAAAAIELTHEFSLIHDDLQDRDRTRRGRPAVWTRIGVAQAIGAGDVLFSIARRELASVEGLSDEARTDVFQRYDAACIRLAEGQYLDLRFEDRVDVRVDEYVGMVARKTGALLSAAAGIGARLGGASAEAAEALADAGLSIGIAFQARDDILGLWGAAGQTGKPAGNDLRRGKKSLPIVFALEQPAVAALLRSFWQDGAPEDRVDDTLEAIERCGALDFAERQAETHADRAISALQRTRLDPEAAASLEALAREAIRRTD